LLSALPWRAGTVIIAALCSSPRWASKNSAQKNASAGSIFSEISSSVSTERIHASIAKKITDLSMLSENGFAPGVAPLLAVALG
jgi:hypothetical protein